MTASSAPHDDDDAPNLGRLALAALGAAAVALGAIALHGAVLVITIRNVM